MEPETLESLATDKQGRAMLARLAKRHAARKLMRDRQRAFPQSPKQLEAARQARRVERQTANAALAAAEKRVDAVVAELNALQKAHALAVTNAAAERETAQAKVREAAAKVTALQAQVKDAENKANHALRDRATAIEGAKALEDRLNAQRAEMGKLAHLIKEAEAAAKVVVDARESVTAERDVLKQQVATLQAQFAAQAMELEGLKKPKV